ncbi:MAG: AMP-binding protein [Chloroflexota bacterium]
MLKNLDSKVALIYGNRKITYNELRKSISLFNKLYFLNESEHAVLFAENSPEWITAFYSVWHKKGIIIPVDNLATPHETAYILNDCRPKVIFTSTARLEVISKAIEISGVKSEVILIDNQNNTEEPLSDEPVTFEHPDENKTAVIIYTSGTTGQPKGVMLSYRNLITNITAVSHDIEIFRPNSVIMMLLPAHHVFPMMGTVVIPLYIGATVAISPSMLSADIMATLKDCSVNIIIGVPRLYAAIRKGVMDKINKSFVARLLFAIARKVNSIKFSKKIFRTVHEKMGGHLEFLVSGGAALDKEVGGDFLTLGFEVLEGFGMTEAAPMITFTRPGRVRLGSPGEVMPQTKVVINNGEILASGPNIMQGYYNKPEETAEILIDGWLYTGDLGYLDKEGFLFITGRKKEIIILSNGKNVNPVELEDTLSASPYIKECGVFYHDDQLQVMIVPEISEIIDNEGMSLEDFMKWKVIEPFNNTVSAYKKIMGIHLTDDDLPRTRLGKLQRYKLPSLAILADIDDELHPEIPVSHEFSMIADYIEIEKSRKVLPKHHLEMDLGMDSLDKVSLQAWLIQAFGVDIDPSEMMKFQNVEKLADYVAENKVKLEEGKLDWTDIIKEKVNLKLPSNWFTGRWMIYSSKLFFYLYFSFKAKGTENIPEGPVIFVPNHQSSFDGLFVASFLKRRMLKKTYFYAKEKHFKQAWLKFLASRNNIIIVDINRDLKESIQKMAEVLRQDRSLIIFPEGTRTRTGNLGEFKKTFAILSTELKIPIVPVSIKGAFEALPSGSKFPRPWKRIRVEFLSPVYPGTHSYETLTDEVKKKIQGALK